MCWIDDLLDFWFGDRGLSDGAEAGRAGTKGAVPPKAEAPGYPSQQSSSASSLNPLSDIPEMFLRPELITTVREPDGAAVEEAERVLRR